MEDIMKTRDEFTGQTYDLWLHDRGIDATLFLKNNGRTDLAKIPPTDLELAREAASTGDVILAQVLLRMAA